MIVFISTCANPMLTWACCGVTCATITYCHRKSMARAEADRKGDIDARKKKLKPDGDGCQKELS